MLFHEAAARALSDQGIDTVFGVLGDGNMFLIDSFQRAAGGKFYSMGHESGGVLAANGYARTSGRLGVATVTHGPALTNTVTALVESVKDHTPLLLVAGDTAVADRDNLQNISQREIVTSTGAGFEQVRSPESVFRDIAVAIRRAHLERRPVVLNVPVEFGWREVDYAPVHLGQLAPQAIRPDPAAVEEAVGVIAAANRPIVLAGQGTTTPEAKAALVRLGSRIGAPLATSLRGRDLFRGEPADLGIFGDLSHEVALETIAAADTIVAFGASLNRWTAAEGATLNGKRVVHVDIDRTAIGQFSGVDVGVVGEVAAVADAFVEMLDEAEVKPTGFASPALADRLASWDRRQEEDLSTAETVDIRTAVRRVEAAFPADRTLVHDVGRFMLHTFALMHVPTPRAFVSTTNFGAIGLGMGNAVGAYFGAPERPVLLVTGDGGFMLGGLTEFNSAVRHGVDLVVVVLNDGAYGAEHVHFRRRNMDPALSTMAWPDFGPVATALGGRGFTAHNLAELDEALTASQQRDRPVLIDVKIDPDRVPMPGR